MNFYKLTIGVVAAAFVFVGVGMTSSATVEAKHSTSTGTAPVVESVTPDDGSDLSENENGDYVLTIEASDENGDLSELEFDNNLEPEIPQFSVYASSTNPTGGEQASFNEADVSVSYDDNEKKWKLVLSTDEGGDGYSVKDVIDEKGGVEFYIRVRDEAGHKSSSFDPTIKENTYTYSLCSPKYEVGNGSGKVENVNTAETFSTIQDAIDDCDTENGDTIEVAPGDYEEGVTIDKEDITLKSVAGPKATKILADEKVGVRIEKSGATVRGFTITTTIDSKDTYGNYGIRVMPSSGDINDILIEDNIVEDISDVYRPAGISLDLPDDKDWTADNVTIEGNIVRNITGEEEESDDEKSLDGTKILAKGINANELFNNLQIKDNVVHGIGGQYSAGANGIDLSSRAGVGPKNFTIEGNDIDDISVEIEDNRAYMDDNALYLHKYDDLGEHSVTKNNFRDGHVLYNTGDITEPNILNAEENWWADSDGPSGDAGEQDSEGAKVSENVNYSPWLCDEYTEEGELKTTNNGNCGPYQDEVFSGDDKIKICKAFGNGSYNNKDQSVNSITESSLADSGINTDNIIPPFVYRIGDGGTELFEGHNWSENNQATWGDNCGVDESSGGGGGNPAPSRSGGGGGSDDNGNEQRVAGAQDENADGETDEAAEEETEEEDKKEGMVKGAQVGVGEDMTNEEILQVLNQALEQTLAIAEKIGMDTERLRSSY